MYVKKILKKKIRFEINNISKLCLCYKKKEKKKKNKTAHVNLYFISNHFFFFNFAGFSRIRIEREDELSSEVEE